MLKEVIKQIINTNLSMPRDNTWLYEKEKYCTMNYGGFMVKQALCNHWTFIGGTQFSLMSTTALDYLKDLDFNGGHDFKPADLMF